MPDQVPPHTSPDPAHLRLTTLIRIRWLAIAGQLAAIATVALILGFPMPGLACAALVAASVVLNLWLQLRYPANMRLSPASAFFVLAFDVVQLSGLLYLTGGLQNPFAILVIVPVVISATVLPVRQTLALAIGTMTFVSALALHHHPLPWYEGSQLVLPFALIAGIWVAINATLIFTSIYAWRLAAESRQLADALAATELVLQRETHLSALDGLAAAAAHELGTPLATIALVVKELTRSGTGDSGTAEDLQLLASQTERCREILGRLRSLSSQDGSFIERQSLSELIEDVIAPHRNFGVAIETATIGGSGPEPATRRNPGVTYGLGNIVENAVDFARSDVVVRTSWDDDSVTVSVLDDGAGFPPDVLDRIGEPYVSGGPRRERESGGGLGLGVFIARTLLLRSGADVSFRNRPGPGQGAEVSITWQRAQFEWRDAAG